MLAIRVAILVLAASPASVLFASQTGDSKTLSIEVHDSRGVPLSGAVVEMRAGATLLIPTAALADRFTLPEPPAGDYSVSVRYHGATATCKELVHLPRVGPPLVLELSADGNLSVHGDGTVEAGTGGEQLSSKAVSELPLNKRDFSQLLLLAAGP